MNETIETVIDILSEINIAHEGHYIGVEVTKTHFCPACRIKRVLVLLRTIQSTVVATEAEKDKYDLMLGKISVLSDFLNEILGTNKTTATTDKMVKLERLHQAAHAIFNSDGNTYEEPEHIAEIKSALKDLEPTMEERANLEITDAIGKAEIKLAIEAIEMYQEVDDEDNWTDDSESHVRYAMSQALTALQKLKGWTIEVKQCPGHDNFQEGTFGKTYHVAGEICPALVKQETILFEPQLLELKSDNDFNSPYVGNLEIHAAKLKLQFDKVQDELEEVRQDRDDGDCTIDSLNKIISEMKDCGDCQEIERINAQIAASAEREKQLREWIDKINMNTKLWKYSTAYGDLIMTSEEFKTELETLSTAEPAKDTPDHVWILYIFRNGGVNREIRGIYNNHEKALEAKKRYQEGQEMCEIYKTTVNK